MQPSDHAGEHQVPSPFAESEVLPSSVGRKRRNRLLTIVLTFVVATGIAGTVWYLIELNDPLRSLHPFPVDEYFQDYRPLAGSKFRADLTIDADLGWKEGMGKLLVFTAGENHKPFAVLIPPEMSETYFQKSHTFSAELEVQQGGLIVAKQLHAK